VWSSKARIFLKRSKISPLDIRSGEGAFPVVCSPPTVPRPNLLGSPYLSGPLSRLFELTVHLCSPVPFLKKLALIVIHTERPIPRDDVFDGDLSSLHELRLDGVVTHLAWANMSNPRAFTLSHIPGDTPSDSTSRLSRVCPSARDCLRLIVHPQSSLISHRVRGEQVFYLRWRGPRGRTYYINTGTRI
jgi:hypothetical protein